MTMTTFKAISFDLDDTLWEVTPVIVRAEKILNQWLADNHPGFAQYYSVKKLREMRMKMFKDEPHWLSDLTEARKESLRRAAVQMGYPVEFVEPAFKAFHIARNEVVFYDDAMPVLEQLVGNYHLASLSNGNARLEMVGLSHIFTVELSASFDMLAKPSPNMFYQACDAFGIQTDELLHVGDSPQSDVLGGQQAGVRTAWLNRDGAAQWPDDLPPPDFELATLHQLLDILEC